MDRVTQLQKFTKDYFFESDEFFFSTKYVNKKKKNINLVYSAYNLEYNLVLKDYKIFFDNKLKDKFVINTVLARTAEKKRFLPNKYSLVAKKLKNYRFYDKNFDFRDISTKPSIVFNFRVNKKRKQLILTKLKSKILTKKFFYQQLLKQ
jgi:hypothetical protein